MRRFHCPQIPQVGQVCCLPEEEGRHAAAVLRLRPGDTVELLDGTGVRADAEIADIAGKGRRLQVSCTVVARHAVPPFGLRIRLYVAPPRPKPMSRVLCAAAELGVAAVVPILCRYSVARPADDVRESWLRELVAACKQSGNAHLPTVEPPAAFADAVGACPANGWFGAVPREGEDTGDAAPEFGDDVCLWVGPEGGFTPEEEDALRARGLRPLTVGPCILRVETAVPALLGAIHAMHGPARGRGDLSSERTAVP